MNGGRGGERGMGRLAIERGMGRLSMDRGRGGSKLEADMEGLSMGRGLLDRINMCVGEEDMLALQMKARGVVASDRGDFAERPAPFMDRPRPNPWNDVMEDEREVFHPQMRKRKFVEPMSAPMRGGGPMRGPMRGGPPMRGGFRPHPSEMLNHGKRGRFGPHVPNVRPPLGPPRPRLPPPKLHKRVRGIPTIKEKMAIDLPMARNAMPMFQEISKRRDAEKPNLLIDLPNLFSILKEEKKNKKSDAYTVLVGNLGSGVSSIDAVNFILAVKTKEEVEISMRDAQDEQGEIITLEFKSLAQAHSFMSRAKKTNIKLKNQPDDKPLTWDIRQGLLRWSPSEGVKDHVKLLTSGVPPAIRKDPIKPGANIVEVMRELKAESLGEKLGQLRRSDHSEILTMPVLNHKHFYTMKKGISYITGVDMQGVQECVRSAASMMYRTLLRTAPTPGTANAELLESILGGMMTTNHLMQKFRASHYLHVIKEPALRIGMQQLWDYDSENIMGSLPTKATLHKLSMKFKQNHFPSPYLDDYIDLNIAKGEEELNEKMQKDKQRKAKDNYRANQKIMLDKDGNKIIPAEKYKDETQ